MVGTIRLNQIVDYANNQMEKLLRAAVLETDSLLNKQVQLILVGFVLAGR